MFGLCPLNANGGGSYRFALAIVFRASILFSYWLECGTTQEGYDKARLQWGLICKTPNSDV